jgi:hypothetical protein
MGDVVNLNKRRKAAAKERAAEKAVENRVRFGTPKATQDATRRDSERSARDLDLKRLD